MLSNAFEPQHALHATYVGYPPWALTSVVPSFRPVLPQTLVEVFHWPLLRWFEQQQDAARAGETSCPVSRADIDSVFSNVDELIAFSRYGVRL